jgi:hypothetical protein
LKKKIFTPETDFEKQNLDVISKLRNIKDQELSNDFDKKLFEKILADQIYFVKPESVKEKLIKLLKAVTNPHNPITYLAYASVLIGVFFVGGSLFHRDVKQTAYENSAIKNTNTENVNNSAPQNAIALRKTAKDFAQSKDKKYINNIYKKVLMNIDYGVLNCPSRVDVYTILNSEQFAAIISGLDSPGITDTVNTIIKIWEEQN